MRYCTRCILPDTRPQIELGDGGVCSACRAHRDRGENVDWAARASDFQTLVDRVRRLGRTYDCVIPVSGGKDSTWQTAVCLEHGLHPLAVTWRTPARTELGRQNLDNLIELGVDHIDFSVNPQVERRFVYRAFAEHGTTALPMHMAIFSIPVTLAARWDVPLVVWGENSAAEYSGIGRESTANRLDADWRRKFGVTHGTTASDWVSEDLTRQDLTPYFGPTDEELADRGIEAVFLGWFFQWDPAETARIAQEHGFSAREEGPLTGYYSYADVDDAFIISVHHWMKWLKFGFTRTWDNLSLEIRNGRLTRDEAIGILAERGDETPHRDIESLCEWLGISTEHFLELAERFRSDDVWMRRDGRWVIDGFLIDDWKWA